MRLFLARHGNTFSPEDNPYYVGKNIDLPLVLKGQQQAKDLGRVFLEKKIHFNQIYCNPLKRTKVFADIVRSESSQSVQVKEIPALNELSYGSWEGKTTPEVKTLHPKEFALWEEQGVWPKNCDWEDDEKEVISEVLEFAKKFENLEGDFLCISSNGRLRYFLNLIQNLYIQMRNENKLKMKTGNLSMLSFENNAWNLNFWNKSSAEYRET